MHPATKNWLELIACVVFALLFGFFLIDNLVDEDWLFAALDLLLVVYWTNQIVTRWRKV